MQHCRRCNTVQRYLEADEFKEMEAQQSRDQLFQKWTVHSAQVRSKLKVPHDWNPWTPNAELHCVPTHNKRVMQMLDIGYIQVLKEAQRQAGLKRNPKPYRPDLLVKDFWCDVSQAVQRKPYGPLATLHTNSWWYSYEHDILLPGLAHVAFHGFPSNMDWSDFGTEAQQNSAARHLMGESFSLPTASTVLMSLFLVRGAPWWEPTKV